MNKQITLLIAITSLFTGFNLSAIAQWDLNGVAADTMSSAAPGSAGKTQLGGPYQQPYKLEGVPVNHAPAQYDQRGNILNPNSNLPLNSYSSVPAFAPGISSVGSASRGGGGTLPSTIMPALSSMQGFNLPRQLKGMNLQGLPPTTLDSFVLNAGGAASRIYGDEGTGMFGPPPQNGFPESSSINAGIVGVTNKALTTGHGSKLPAPSQVNMYSPVIPITKSGAR